MQISFQTKEESKKIQQEAFLKLTKAERVYAFFRLMEQMSRFPTKNKTNKNSENFVIIIPEKIEK